VKGAWIVGIDCWLLVVGCCCEEFTTETRCIKHWGVDHLSYFSHGSCQLPIMQGRHNSSRLHTKIVKASHTRVNWCSFTVTVTFEGPEKKSLHGRNHKNESGLLCGGSVICLTGSRTQYFYARRQLPVQAWACWLGKTGHCCEAQEKTETHLAYCIHGEKCLKAIFVTSVNWPRVQQNLFKIEQ